MDSIIYDSNSLKESVFKCKKGSDWKETVQKYVHHWMINNNETKNKLISKKYHQDAPCKFSISERGKKRNIKALTIKDRVVKNSVTENILNPIIEKYCIYDNGASQKGKGVKFARDRIKRHLIKYYNQYGDNNGYVVLMDYHGFFDSIDHKKLGESLKYKIKDKDTFNFVCYGIEANNYSEDFIDYENYNGELTGNGVGIGAQDSQAFGIFFPTYVDNWVKIVKSKSAKYYERYMDDSFTLCRTKEEAKEIMRGIVENSEKYNLIINSKKCKIVKLSHGFTFLKYKYFLNYGGSISISQNNETFIRERRKLKKWKNTKMWKEDIENSYRSWRGNVKKIKRNRLKIKQIDKIFINNFPKYEYLSKKELKCKKKRKEI